MAGLKWSMQRTLLWRRKRCKGGKGGGVSGTRMRGGCEDRLGQSEPENISQQQQPKALLRYLGNWYATVHCAARRQQQLIVCDNIDDVLVLRQRLYRHTSQ
eukprot:3920132-Pleurochrysis_carterae.AAC.2